MKEREMQVFVKIGDAVLDAGSITGVEVVTAERRTFTRIHLRGTTIDVDKPIESVLQFIGSAVEQARGQAQPTGHVDESTGLVSGGLDASPAIDESVPVGGESWQETVAEGIAEARSERP